ncbi:MAG: flagellar motor protein MotD [Xanthomonadaceae bacterium]|nr:flagellar motor protein MotD [Xanthomonadaceae bacterium]
MARRRAHEEHANHEAWAIPYGDLVTLLLALFVVLYSMSSVNEGKYRVLSDSLNEAFGGRPRSPSPIQIGDNPQRGTVPSLVNLLPRPGAGAGRAGTQIAPVRPPLPSYGQPRGGERDIRRMAAEVQKAMGTLIDRKLVAVRSNGLTLEIEIRADILFPSGVAEVSDAARPVLARVAGILKPFPNPVRVEGHTDDVPIATPAFPSNWQLSSARAASVVALFMAGGLDPIRLSVAGFGEFQPKAPNATAEGRNANRRVLIVVLGTPEAAVAAQDPAAGPPRTPAPPEAAAANPAPADTVAAEAPTIAPMPAYSAADAASDQMVDDVLASELLPHQRAAASSP